MTTLHSPQALRQSMISKRNALSMEEQLSAEKALVAHFVKSSAVQDAQHIGLYCSTAGEMSTKRLIQYCWQANKDVYLPVLHPFSKGYLLFLRYQPNTEVITNRYGIVEPKLRLDAVIPAKKLDLICAPLVAFDLKGNRLGMGGGYYDRLFADTDKAIRIGLAHDLQQVEALNAQAWDMPLAQVITPNKHWYF